MPGVPGQLPPGSVLPVEGVCHGLEVQPVRVGVGACLPSSCFPCDQPRVDEPESLQPPSLLPWQWVRDQLCPGGRQVSGQRPEQFPAWSSPQFPGRSPVISFAPVLLPSLTAATAGLLPVPV